MTTQTGQRRRPAPVPTHEQGADPVARAVTGAIAVGASLALGLMLVVFAASEEPRITGSALVGLACTFALLRRWSARWATPQRWAAVPAAAFGVAGVALLVAAPGAAAMDAIAWAWPLPVAALVVWTWSRARRDLPRRGRLLLAPVLVVLLAAAAGAVVQDVARVSAQPAPGELYDIGGRSLHLSCRGPETGGPTVVLSNGLGGSSANWAMVTKAVTATGTRVCAFDRAGQGWSDPAPGPQDAVAAAEDMHTVLDRAGERPPYVLAGHSTGGTYALTYAHLYREQVAGMVLLDSSSPEQATRMPGFTTELSLLRRVLALAPSLSRVAPGLGLTPAQARNLHDEQAVLLEVFRQAQSVRTLGHLPLAVVTASENAASQDWAEAQDALAGLSDDHVHRIARSSHEGLLLDVGPAAESAAAIDDVVAAVSSGHPLQP